MEKSILEEQLDYYRARATEYDEWHLRQGRYYRGAEHRKKWFLELDNIRSALIREKPLGDCLELACGTGLWTVTLANLSTKLMAIDAVSETIEINRNKIGENHVQFIVADIFKWEPTETYDFIFFGFWLSHVPSEKFDKFWKMVGQALKPNGRIFFVDSLKIQDSTAVDHARIDFSGTAERKINSGEMFKIVKIFYDPSQLQRILLDCGFSGTVQKTGDFFYYGCLKRCK